MSLYAAICNLLAIVIVAITVYGLHKRISSLERKIKHIK